MTSLSNRDCRALLIEWGFEEVGGNGGHLIMQREGRKVQISAVARQTPTPYRALRKAARIVGVTLQELLSGPKQEKKKMPEAIAIRPIEILTKEENVSSLDTIDAPDDTDVLTCPDCGKSGFAAINGLQGHMRSHERVLCNTCNKEFSRQGIDRHRAACGQAARKRRPGRPRRPIAEALETTRRRGPKDLDVEVPILENLDDTFPEPAAFFHTPVEPVSAEGVLKPEQVEVNDGSQANLKAAFEAVLPGVALTDERFTAFLGWVEGARAMFSNWGRN